MKMFRMVLMAFCFCFFINGNLVFSQTGEKSNINSVSTRTKDKKKAEPGDEFPENEIESLFRYVIVKDDVIFDDDKGKERVATHRFVEVLMDERAFTEANLIQLFRYLSNYYADPLYLGITVHTNLMTLETLEESVTVLTHSSRDKFRRFYKTSSYGRYNDGSESFFYDTGKPGKFVTKWLSLTKTTKK